MEPEIILNLWFVRDHRGLLYSLRARCYVATGSDEEKLAFLRGFATQDYLIAQEFPLPEPSGDTQIRPMRVTAKPANENRTQDIDFGRKLSSFRQYEQCLDRR